MLVDGLVIPDELTKLIAAGKWPSTGKQAATQNLNPKIVGKKVSIIDPQASHVYLMPPPFFIVSKLTAEHEHFWMKPYANPEGISYNLSIPIADFGWGSDSPIIFDFRNNAQNPAILFLQWVGRDEMNEWKEMFPDFAEFVNYFDLWNIDWSDAIPPEK